MPRLSLVRAGMAVAAILIGSPALSAEAPPSDHRLALAKQFFAEIHMDRTMDTMMKSILPAMVEQTRKANPNISPEQNKAMLEAVAEAMGPMTNKMIDRMIPVYASTFTEKELQDLVNFYGTGSGQAMLEKMPQLTAKMTPMMVEMMPEMQADMLRRLCSKIDCKARGAPSAGKS